MVKFTVTSLAKPQGSGSNPESPCTPIPPGIFSKVDARRHATSPNARYRCARVMERGNRRPLGTKSLRVCGVVKARVTSGSDGCRFDSCRRRKLAVAQWIEQRTNTWAADSRRNSCRDGAEKSYFVCQTTWGCGPATLIDYSSRLNVGRRESRTSRRFAPGLGKRAAKDGGATRICSRQCFSRDPRS
jgi:hypothetical protein